jgi:hypothetical protein
MPRVGNKRRASGQPGPAAEEAMQQQAAAAAVPSPPAAAGKKDWSSLPHKRTEPLTEAQAAARAAQGARAGKPLQAWTHHNLAALSTEVRGARGAGRQAWAG